MHIPGKLLTPLEKVLAKNSNATLYLRIRFTFLALLICVHTVHILHVTIRYKICMISWRVHNRCPRGNTEIINKESCLTSLYYEPQNLTMHHLELSRATLISSVPNWHQRRRKKGWCYPT